MAKELLKFIAGKTFEKIVEELTEKPYCLKVQEKDDLYLLKYDQINSSFGEPIVQECRGIILQKGTNKIIAYPFDKFFNYGEGHAAQLYWPSVRFVEKIDGSLIKLYHYKGKWTVATNGTIDSHDAPACSVTGKSFYDLWIEASSKYFDTDKLDLHPDYTYMFELVHPVSKVVVYHEPNIYFLGCRHRNTFVEYDKMFGKISTLYGGDNGLTLLYDSVPRPKVYPLGTLEEAIEASLDLPFDEEGYVVVDKDFNRQKIKSPAYVACSHMKDGLNSEKNIMKIVMHGEIDEVAALFPEYSERLNIVKERYDIFVAKVQNDWDTLKDAEYPTRKDFALLATKTASPGTMFSLFDDKHKTVGDSLKHMSAENMVKMVNKD